MRIDIFKALIENSTLLVVVFLFLTRFSRWRIGRESLIDLLIQGLTYAVCAVLAMFFSVEVLPGVLIDMRTPILVVAAFTGGPVVGVIALIPLLAYRISIGGVGMAPGIGIILSAFVFGLLLRLAERSRFRPSGFLFQLFIGLGSAAIYLAWILVLPDTISVLVFRVVVIPICIASVLSILAIFLIRTREESHQKLIERLTEANNLFEEISGDQNIGIVVLQRGRIVHVNKTLLKKFGFSRLDEENSDLFQLVDSDTRKRLEAFFIQNSAASSAEAVPIQITLKNSISLHLLVHARELVYQGRKSLLVISVDVSSLVEAERNLQNRVDQLQLTIDASGAVRWTASVAEDRLAVDDEFFKVLAYTPPENPPRLSHWLLEMSFSDQMRDDLDALFSGSIERLFGEISYRGDDFVTRWFNIAAIARGKPPHVYGILFDTTVIKKKELSLMQEEIENIQSQKMESIGRLAGGVAHDFNNLLHVIMGYCDILNRVSDNDPVITDVSKPIVEAAAKGRELVKQLLLFSRDKKPSLQRIDLSILTDDFDQLLSRIIEDNIVISTEINSDNCWTFGDPGQIEQVLMNLCVNARDAMPNGGSINVALNKILLSEPGKVTSGTIKAGNYVTITVSDTGPGIPEADHWSIFEPFFTTKTIDGGTGLGLATVIGIVNEHSGHIDVANRVESGLEIKVYFPELKNDLHTPEAAVVTHTPQSREINNRRTICILLAEDDPQVMNLAIEGLGAAGIAVLRASNGREAIEIYKQNQSRIEMLVFDVMMPEVNGPDAYKAIKSMGSDIPVIFTTGYAGDRLTGMDSTHEVINKPYAINDLVSAIRRMTHVEKGDK